MAQECVRHNGEPFDSRTQTAAHTTAGRLGKSYRDGGAQSEVADKHAARPDDGYVTSAAMACPLSAAGSPGDSALAIDFHHPLEDWIRRDAVRRLLGYLARSRPGRRTIIEEVIESYGDAHAPLGQRIKYWPLHRVIDWIRGRVPIETFRQRISEHRATVRGLVSTVRAVAEFGLTVPQRWGAPLFAVWNFTNRCNLQCKHCYQDSAHEALADELTLAEKLELVDQMAEEYVAMVAFAGGEPTISPDLLPVLKRCQQHGIHMSVATNGTTMTPRLAAELAAAGVRYVEISLDSVHAAQHDAFRGQPGMWHRTVRGMRHVVAQEGLRLGIAMCIHRGNVDELEAMLQFAVDIGAGCFAHFNFIPVGRGLEMTAGDLSPRQRQNVLDTLNAWMQAGRIGVISTAPQLGRVCLVGAPAEGRQSCSHAGSGSGMKARVVAKYLGGCGAGRTYVCIEPAGDITPCVYMPQRVLGNIRRRGFREIFRNNAFTDLLCDRTQLTHHCEVCRFKNYCGGCRARADSYYGAVNAGDPGCIFNEKHWEKLVQAGVAPVDTSADVDYVGAMPSGPLQGYDGCKTTWSTGRPTEASQ